MKDEKLSFDEGFQKKLTVLSFGEKREVLLVFSAYYEKDGLTAEQFDSYARFDKSQESLLPEVESRLLVDFPEAKTRFQMTMVLIQRDGTLALLYDDAENMDDGMALQLFPEIKMMTQDEFL